MTHTNEGNERVYQWEAHKSAGGLNKREFCYGGDLDERVSE
jgi:hypothetical protein